ncbi:aldo/keto reductase [Deinococcus peraridilitoris]|uniref:Putative oxidoreductase, aryl-alcohol dehydrogenase like protein n=1 Tax=Deinococcus peraridilitoris (strain DSM 19664 / LMG 22246 / CIP 109416 / KR-200) TaxID=937777 RepID=L0A169_DEIPD|nr:aldo/keto reductase [Deinococcus peraridilitoris]AFZ67618.1 putative oxidoreductase, aryl-alcohol dehydrogenase like protein [Deinococcus peraridilitoris DSM 19664]
MNSPYAPRTLSRSKLSLPSLGFGTAPLGGLHEAVPDTQARDVLQSSWQLGFRYYDTAPLYGYGLAEERLGALLQDHSDFIVSSKVGRVLRPDIPPHPTQLESDGSFGFKSTSKLNVEYDYSYDGVLRSFEDSLRRLQVARIDLLFIHDPDAVGVGVGELMRGAYRALHELREQGMVTAIGAGMNQWQMPAELLKAGEFDVFLLAGRYTLFEQDSLHGFMDRCQERGIGVVIGGVYNSGLLAAAQPGATYNYSPASPETLQRAQAIDAVCARHAVSLKQAALHFPFGHPAVTSVLVASRHAGHVLENTTLLQQTVPAELWQDLKHEGLLGAHVPVPAPGA